MPTNPTGEEVRELKSRADELLAVFSREGRHAYRPFDCDEVKLVAKLCRHFLASQQPMTAGEFAGLVKRRLSENKQFHEANANMPVRSLSDSLDKKSHEEKARLCGLANDVLCNLAREHNITIVEPKK